MELLLGFVGCVWMVIALVLSIFLTAYTNRDMLTKFREIFDNELLIVNRDLVLVGSDVEIIFRCGDVLKMAGIKPNYYNVDTYNAAEFLAQSAIKVNGEEIESLNKIIDIVVKYVNEHYLKEG